MESENITQIEKDFKNNTIIVTRDFNASIAKVWRACTESDILGQWWAPAPWRNQTKVMNFTKGGYWLYAMVSPEGEKHWGRMNFVAIDHHKRFNIEDAFCDENGNLNKDLPVSKGQISFKTVQNKTRVEFKMIYPTEGDLKKIVEMGFEQGITICFDQLGNLFIQNKI